MGGFALLDRGRYDQLAKHRLDLADEHAADAEVAQQHGPAWPLRGTEQRFPPQG